MFDFLGKPDSPSQPTVSDIKATQMRVSWTPPDFGGGTPIIGYLIEYKESSSTNWVRVSMHRSTDTTIIANDLHENTQYQFRVSAENPIGLGSCSTSSNWYKTLGR